MNNAFAVTRELPHDREAERFAATDALTGYVLSVSPQHDEVSETLARKFCGRVVRCAEVFAKKQSDYGPENIAAFGEFGLLVRVNDKMSRLKNLMGREAACEALDDTWLDIGVYGFIAGLVRDGEWPGCKDEHRLDFVKPADAEAMTKVIKEERDDAWRAIILLDVVRAPVEWRRGLGLSEQRDDRGTGETLVCFIKRENEAYGATSPRVKALYAAIMAVENDLP